MTKLPTYVADLWRFLRSTPRAANLSALVALLVWIVKAVWLDHRAGLFPGAYDLGRVVEGILSAIIAGWVFYLFFALLPEARQKSLIAPFVLRTIATIAGDARGVLQEIEKATGNTLSFSQAAESDLATAFSKVAFQSTTTLMLNVNGRYATWLEFFHYRRDRTKNQLRELKEQARYVEPELMAALLRLSKNSFFGMAEGMEGSPVLNKDLSVFAPGFYRYLLECRRIVLWHDNHLGPGDVAIGPSLG
jgi:hypothetical protein